MRDGIMYHTRDEIFNSHVEIIYKEKGMVCMIPKTLIGSAIFGLKTRWCQIYSGGFQHWSQQALLVRFLIKDKNNKCRKLRFTYFFPSDKANDSQGQDYYWANEAGLHVLWGKGNPFEAKSPKEDRIRETEQDILEVINLISKECQNKVLQFVEKHRNSYVYNYLKDITYTPKKEALFFNRYYDVDDELHNQMRDISNEKNIQLYTSTCREEREYIIYHRYEYNQQSITERFKNIVLFKNRCLELIEFYKSKPPDIKPETPVYAYEWHEGEMYF